MSYLATVYKIMIASPSDVKDEREIIREVISEWNIIHSESRQIVLLPRGWETHSIPEMSEPPQDLINKQVLQGSDLLVGVFWTRIGTATNNYDSGTVEEIEEHRKAGKPALLYFSTAPISPDSINSEQYSRLEEFQKNCQSSGLCQSYSNTEEFRSKFSRQLQLKLNQEDFRNNSVTDPTTQPTVPKLNLSQEARTLLKKCSLSKDGQIIKPSIVGIPFQLQVGSEFLVEREDTPQKIALWREALKQLEDNGLIEAMNPERNIFTITAEGYRVLEKNP